MHPTTNFVSVSTLFLATFIPGLPLLTNAAPAPAPSPEPFPIASIPSGLCHQPGQFVCVSSHTFALCDASLHGIEQPLAAGDNRCVGKGPAAPAAPPAKPAPAAPKAPAPVKPAPAPAGPPVVPVTVALSKGQAPTLAPAPKKPSPTFASGSGN
ncbi:hypothetical protein KCU88_g6602, partial [Aureobasidium melanogenum]